jgi:hypothetical protein
VALFSLFEISSHATPIIAALLVDPGTVDISLSGDSIQANTRRGVFRVKKSVSRQAFAGNDD